MSHQPFFPYGAVLKVQRDHTPEYLAAAMRHMKRLGLNTVVIWPAVFWWEPRGADYPFAAGRMILHLAAEIGLKVIVELAGQISSLEYLPDSVMKDEYLATKFDGRYDNEQSYYGIINYHHPEVRRIITDYLLAAARAYKDCPALLAYDLWNETLWASYDNHTLAVFQQWLKDKYGVIDHLNDAWDRAYTDWSQIRFARWCWASVMPYVDVHQFQKACIGRFLAEWRQTIRSVDPAHPVIADNIGSMITVEGLYEHLHQDDWIVARNVDEYGISLYPRNTLQGMPDAWRWETLAVAASASGQRGFWVSELQSHHQAMFNTAGTVRPADLKLWNWEALAHGARGIIYWKWDPFTRGEQTFGRGLVDFWGQDTERSLAAGQLAKVIADNAELLAGAAPRPQVAILYDTLAHDLTKAYSQAGENRAEMRSVYADSIHGLFAALWEHNVPAAFLRPEDMPAAGTLEYKAIFATSQVNVDANLADALMRYVRAGGLLVCDGRLGVVDNAGALHRDLPGGPLHQALGVDLADVIPGQTRIQMHAPDGADWTMAGHDERQALRLTGAEALGHFEDGAPAVTRSTVGQGAIIYIGTFLWLAHHKTPDPGIGVFMARLADQLGLSQVTAGSNGLRFRILRREDGLVLLAFNYSASAVSDTLTVRGMGAGEYMVRELHTGATQRCQVVQGTLRVDVAVPARDVLALSIRGE